MYIYLIVWYMDSYACSYIRRRIYEQQNLSLMLLWVYSSHHHTHTYTYIYVRTLLPLYTTTALPYLFHYLESSSPWLYGFTIFGIFMSDLNGTPACAWLARLKYSSLIKRAHVL